MNHLMNLEALHEGKPVEHSLICLVCDLAQHQSSIKLPGLSTRLITRLILSLIVTGAWCWSPNPFSGLGFDKMIDDFQPLVVSMEQIDYVNTCSFQIRTSTDPDSSIYWCNCTWYLLPGVWTSEKHRHLSTSTDCSTPVGPVAHYDSLVHSGLLLEDGLQKSTLRQLEKLYVEMARYTNIPLPQTKESQKDMGSSHKASNVSKPEHRVKTEERATDVARVGSRKEGERESEKVSVLNKNKSCHTNYLPEKPCVITSVVVSY